jgi:1,4-alpha-glucan branching enzyme
MRMTTLSPEALRSLLRVDHGDPFSVLGLHEHKGEWVVRVYRPDAKAVIVVDAANPERTWTAQQVDPAGLFEARLTGQTGRLHYRLRFTAHNGHFWDDEDAYAFGSTFGGVDAHLFGEGNHLELWRKLGAHLDTHDGVKGTVFRVWAPNARRVSVVGDWNGWDGRTHGMRKIIPIGVWEIFIPGVAEGAHYKFELLGTDGHLHVKSDPFAFFSQHGTQTASLVWRLDKFKWSDQGWMERRRKTEWQREPVSIYEVHPGSWRRAAEDKFLTWRELADQLLNYAVEMGFTHIELMGVAEYPFEGSWGYQVCGYFAPTSRHGSPDDFRHFINRAHELGLGVILDWVPGHFPKDAHGLARFDGTALYEHADPRQGEHQDWGTLIFNYGRNEVRNFLTANALFWLEEYHVDGLRVDAVASMLYLDYSRTEWIPNVHGGRENLDAIYFLKRCNELCHERHPGVMTVAEESTAWPGVSRPTFLGGLGFSFKWNMGWMHDTLNYMALDPIYRRFHHGQATFSLVYAFHEHFALVLSHDEVVHGKGSLINKMPGDEWHQFANLRMLFGWMWAHPGKKLLFMGGEWGQRSEWSHERSLDWWVLEFPVHSGLRRLVQQLNYLYKNEPALFDQDDTWEGFEWIDLHDSDNSVLAFLRRARHGTTIVFVVNATPLVRENYHLGVPNGGWWREILNTDSSEYGGSNVGNLGGQNAEAIPWMNRSHRLTITLPPLAVVAFKLGEK